jgi:hypothetical protein
VGDGAWAVDGDPDPDPGPGPGDITRTLTVTPPTAGSITSADGLINCPGDCSETYTGAPTVTLSATRSGSGWGRTWSSNCTVVGDTCQVTMSLNRTVSMTWADVGAPAVSWPSNAPTRANYNTTFTASASDVQTNIVEVQFSLPGIVFEDRSAPYQFKPNVDDYFSHGSTYTVTAQARDSAGNTSTATHTFTMDTTAALDAITPTTGLTRCADPFIAQPNCAQPHITAPPSFTFDAASDTTSIGCLTEDVGTQVFDVEDLEQGLTTLSCAPEVPTDTAGQPTYDGAYRTHVFVSDGLNIESYVYEWWLDRRGPTINMFEPQEGSYVKAPFTLNPTGSDQTPPFSYSCDLGSGFGSCAGTFDPPEGPKTLRVRSTDAIGNTRMIERGFIYDKTAPQVNITSGPAEGAFTESGSVAFAFSAADAVGPVTTTCKLDRGDFGACSSGSGHSVDNLNPGIHTFTLRAIDAAGHETVIERLFVVPQQANNTTIVNNTTTTTGGGAVGGAVGGQIETPAPPTAASGRAARKFSVRGGKTTVKRLILSGLARGAKIQVSCNGRGCFRGAKKYTARSSKLNLTKLFKKRKLSARARIEIRIAQPGRATRVFRYTTQKGKKQPKAQSLTV